MNSNTTQKHLLKAIDLKPDLWNCLLLNSIQIFSLNFITKKVREEEEKSRNFSKGKKCVTHFSNKVGKTC